MPQVLAEPECGQIEWSADYGTVALMCVAMDDGGELAIAWDHRALAWFLDDNPEPIGLRVRVVEAGVCVVDDEE